MWWLKSGSLRIWPKSLRTEPPSPGPGPLIDPPFPPPPTQNAPVSPLTTLPMPACLSKGDDLRPCGGLLRWHEHALWRVHYI